MLAVSTAEPVTCLRRYHNATNAKCQLLTHTSAVHNFKYCVIFSNSSNTRWRKRMLSQTQNTERIRKEAENLTHLPTSSATEQSPSWEDNSSRPSQEILRTVWNSTVRYRIHNCPLLVTILGQFKLTHALLKIQNNITLPSRLRSSKLSLFNTFLHQTPAFLFSHIHATCPVCLILLNQAISNCTVQ